MDSIWPDAVPLDYQGDRGLREAWQRRADPGWIVACADAGATYIEHLEGVPWHDTVAPPWHHPCEPQTRVLYRMDMTERCACGAARLNYGRWRDRNSRRAEQGERARDYLASYLPAPTERWLSAAGIADLLRHALRALTRKDTHK